MGAKYMMTENIGSFGKAGLFEHLLLVSVDVSKEDTRQVLRQNLGKAAYPISSCHRLLLPRVKSFVAQRIFTRNVK
jgi:hypothetical protein